MRKFTKGRLFRALEWINDQRVSQRVYFVVKTKVTDFKIVWRIETPCSGLLASDCPSYCASNGTACEEEPVILNLTLSGVDYNMLTDDQVVVEAFKAAILRSVARLSAPHSFVQVSFAQRSLTAFVNCVSVLKMEIMMAVGTNHPHLRRVGACPPPSSAPWLHGCSARPPDAHLTGAVTPWARRTALLSFGPKLIS